MKSVQISGRFVNMQGEPLEGVVSFTPQKVWVVHDGETYPAPAPVVTLENGQFVTELIRTDEDPVGPWFYTIKCPVGTWNFIVDSDGPLRLKNKLPKRFSA